MQSSTQSQFGGKSAAFDGTGDYLNIADSADWNFGSGDFTIDMWVRLDSLSGIQTLYSQYTDSTQNVPGVTWGIWESIGLYFAYHNGTSEPIVLNQGSASTWSTDEWHHVAVVRNGTTWKMYQNGTAIATVSGNSTTMPDIDGVVRIGHRDYVGSSSDYLDGFLDEIRVSKGVARWTTNFTPPTKPYN